MRDNTTNAEKRYLNNWNYNAALILTELEKIAINNGGSICRMWQYPGNAPQWLTERKKYLITNRAILEAIREEKERLEKIKRITNAAILPETYARLERLENIKNDPVLTYYGDYHYITFAVDGNYYYYSMDDNPFFDFHYAKVKIENGNKIKRYYYCSEDKKEWLYDCFFKFNCSNSDRREAANLIYNMLVNAKYSLCSITEKAPYGQIIYLDQEDNDND